MSEQQSPGRAPGDDFGIEAVREVLRLIEKSDITEILIERGDARLHIKRGQLAVAHAGPAPLPPVPPLHPSAYPTGEATPAPRPMFASLDEAGTQPTFELPAGYTITAPMVGTFYAAPSPKEPPFVQEGDEVHIGETVGIVEAMKMMNEIESDVHGRVARIMVRNGQPVEYGQPIMVIEPI